jgi:3-oxoadipate enol-lactonase
MKKSYTVKIDFFKIKSVGVFSGSNLIYTKTGPSIDSAIKKAFITIKKIKNQRRMYFCSSSANTMLTATKDHKIEVNGFTVGYDDTGITGSQTIPILFIHGFPFNRGTWKDQLHYFKNDNRVIAYDIRGFGDSENGSEKASMDVFADDLIGLMDALKIDQAIVCGVSMGGYILLNALERFPERISAAILCNTQSGADSIEAQDKRHLSIQKIEAGGVIDFANATIKKVLTNHTLTHQRDLVEKIKQQIVSTSPKILTGTIKALLHRRDMSASLKSIKVPTLIISGADDALIPPSQSEHLFKNIPDSIFYSIDKAGHLCNVDQPKEFNKQIEKFIARSIK